MAGENQLQTSSIYVGPWNGHKLTLHKAGGKIPFFQGADGISCAGHNCLLWGATRSPSGSKGVELVVHHNHPGKMKASGKTAIISASCVSASTCFATGFVKGKAAILTLHHGKVVKRAKNTGVGPIDCAGSSCIAGGGKTTDKLTGTSVGELATVVKGKETSHLIVDAVAGFGFIAKAGATSYAALGDTESGESDLVTG